ncbi:hypothetical protein Scep_004135 [Stephania cephalantha]|uniref:DUF7755 domain-containing protein n=1 Tax=Stephania cephalantha TaxID=152367 RepID=A0AAP0KRZ7_9MAGN
MAMVPPTDQWQMGIVVFLDNEFQISKIYPISGSVQYLVLKQVFMISMHFQGYASPLRLLPVKEANICTHSLLEELHSSYKVDETRSLYMVKLQTSTVSGSCLSDPNAGILLCLIDGNGGSVLQRITGTPAMNPTVKEAASEFLPFQRGSIDEFIFEGSRLGKIEALWIGPESGVWRLGALSLKVINGSQPHEDQEPIIYSGSQYGFEVEDIILGQGESMSLVELRPRRIAELSGSSLLDLLTIGFSHSKSFVNGEITISQEESMREYADLKSSLLLYDIMLILVGTSILAFFTSEKEALAFLTGGAGGFVYLLLLQRSVDALQAPVSISVPRETETLEKILGRIKTPISSLAIAFVFAFIAVKYQSETTPVMLTPQQVLAAMTGFLSCKVAVLLAAFKPVPSKLENK